MATTSLGSHTHIYWGESRTPKDISIICGDCNGVIQKDLYYIKYTPPQRMLEEK